MSLWNTKITLLIENTINHLMPPNGRMSIQILVYRNDLLV